MTKLLFHGDNLAASRQALEQAVAKEKSSGRQLLTLDGSKIAPQDLDSTLATANLFAEESIIIENLLSRPLSNDKKKLLLLVKEYTGPKNILIWEKKELTKAQITSLGKEVVAQAFKAPAIIFKFLDSLVPGSAPTSLTLLHETAQGVEDGFIFVMTSRHVADLIIAKSGNTASLNPWKKGRLVSQAEHWQEASLLSLHGGLLSVDRAIKTGGTKLSYLDHLDLLLVSLLN